MILCVYLEGGLVGKQIDSFILDIKFVGRTNRGHTGVFIHLPSAVLAFIFIFYREKDSAIPFPRRP